MNMTLEDVLGDSVNDNAVFKALKDTYINTLGDAVNDLKIGELMGYTYDTVSGKWYEDAGMSVEVTDALMKIFAGYTVGQLTDPNFTDDLMDDIKDTLTLKDVLGETVVNGNTVLKALGDVAIGDLADSIDDLMIGELMGYTYDTVSGKWYEDEGLTVEVTDPLMKVLVGYTVADLTDADFGTTLMNAITNSLTLKDVLGETAVNSNNLLKLVADKKLDEITDAFNDLSIGELMGYTQFKAEYDAVSGKYLYNEATGTPMWFKETAVGSADLYDSTGSEKHYTVKDAVNVYYQYVDDKMAQILSEYSVNQLIGTEEIAPGVSFTDDIIDKIKDRFTLRDVLGTVVDSNKVLSLVADEHIGDIADTISNMYIGQIMAPAGKTYAVKTIVFNSTTDYYFDDETPANNTYKALFEVVADAGDATLMLKSSPTTAYAEGGDYFSYVDSEIMQVMGVYKMTDVATAGFAASVVNDMLDKVTVGTIYPDAGTGEGFVSLLDPSW